MCLVLTPLVLEITRRLGRNPIPYLLAVAMSSNIGSVATITGNPQNMMIGSFSRIPYRDLRRRPGARCRGRTGAHVAGHRPDVPRRVPRRLPLEVASTVRFV